MYQIRITQTFEIKISTFSKGNEVGLRFYEVILN